MIAPYLQCIPIQKIHIFHCIPWTNFTFPTVRQIHADKSVIYASCVAVLTPTGMANGILLWTNFTFPTVQQIHADKSVIYASCVAVLSPTGMANGIFLFVLSDGDNDIGVGTRTNATSRH